MQTHSAGRQPSAWGIFLTIATLACVQSQVFALAGPLKSPKGIAHSGGYPHVAQQKVVAALETEGCKFVKGSFVNWVSYLNYEGDARSLSRMLAAMSECPGFTVNITFKKLDGFDWHVTHDPAQRRLDVAINPLSKRIDLEQLQLPPIKAPDIDHTPILEPPKQLDVPERILEKDKKQGNASPVKDGAVVSLESRARAGLVMDIDGDTGKLLPLQRYTSFGGCDWVFEDVGDGYYAIKNRFTGQYLDVLGERFGAVVMAEYSALHGCDWRPVQLKNGCFKLVNRYWTAVRGKQIVLDIDGQSNKLIVAPYSDWGGGCDWKLESRSQASDGNRTGL